MGTRRRRPRLGSRVVSQLDSLLTAGILRDGQLTITIESRKVAQATRYIADLVAWEQAREQERAALAAVNDFAAKKIGESLAGQATMTSKKSECDV